MTNNDQAGKRRHRGRNPKWLKKAVDEGIAHDIVDEPIDIEAVAHHLLERPEYPLPEDYLKVLTAWLEAYNEVRLTHIGSGRQESNWYSLADRLVENGLTVNYACEKAKNCFGLYQDISDLETMFKRHRRNRSKQAKNIDDLVRAILSGDEDKMDKAINKKKGT